MFEPFCSTWLPRTWRRAWCRRWVAVWKRVVLDRVVGQSPFELLLGALAREVLVPLHFDVPGNLIDLLAEDSSVSSLGKPKDS